MRLLKLGRFSLLCILVAFLWADPSLLRAQYGGSCATYNIERVCCTDYGYDCQQPQNCLNMTDGPTGDGDYTAVFENLTCMTEHDGPPGACPSQDGFLVPVLDSDCYTSCETDDDCPAGYECKEGICIPYD